MDVQGEAYALPRVTKWMKQLPPCYHLRSKGGLMYQIGGHNTNISDCGILMDHIRLKLTSHPGYSIHFANSKGN